MTGHCRESSAFNARKFSCPAGNSSSEKIASAGHSGSQSVQSMHSSGSMTSMFGPSWKQSTGQTSTQSMYLHLMQFSVTTNVIHTLRRQDGGFCDRRRCILPKRRGAAKPSSCAATAPQVDRREVMVLDAAPPVVEIAPQREVDAQERDLGPWYLRLVVEHHFEAFCAGRELGRGQSRSKHHVHLVRVQDVHDRE